MSGLVVLSDCAGPERASVKGNTVLESNWGAELAVGTAQLILVENSREVVTVGVGSVGWLAENFGVRFVAASACRAAIQVHKVSGTIRRVVPSPAKSSVLVEHREDLQTCTLSEISGVVVAVGHGDGVGVGFLSALRVGIDVGGTIGTAGHVVVVASGRG